MKICKRIVLKFLQFVEVQFDVDRIDLVVNVLAHLFMLACVEVAAVSKF